MKKKKENFFRHKTLCLAALGVLLSMFVFSATVFAALPQKNSLSFYGKGGFLFPGGSFYAWQTRESGMIYGRAQARVYAGFRFIAKKDGYISELCGYFNGIRPIDLFDGDYNLLSATAVSSEERWACAEIPPVVLRQGQDYYLVSEIDEGAMYYRYRIPDKNIYGAIHGIEIREGVTQTLDEPFGSGILADGRAVYGLVDLKVDYSGLQPDGYELPPTALEIEGAAIKNCSQDVCVYCSNSGCFEEKTGEGGHSGSYLTVCASGACLNCRGLECGYVPAKNWAGKNRFFLKNCLDGRCVNCINGDCAVSGEREEDSRYAACGGRFCGPDVAAAALSAFNDVWGGCGENSCGRGGISHKELAVKTERSIPRSILTAGGKRMKIPSDENLFSTNCSEGVCEMCAGYKCATIGIGLNGQSGNKAAEKDTSSFEDKKKVLAIKVATEVADADPPVISDLSPEGTISGPQATLVCETNEDAFCRLCEIDKPFPEMCKTFSETGAKKHSLTIGPMAAGDYNYYVRCRDRTGNENGSASVIKFSVSGGQGSGSTKDAVPPSINSLSAVVDTDSGIPLVAIKTRITDDSGGVKVKARIIGQRGGCESVVYLGDAGLNGDEAAFDSIYGAKWPAGDLNFFNGTVEVIATDAFGNFSIREKEISNANVLKAFIASKLAGNEKKRVPLFVFDFLLNNGGIEVGAVSKGMGSFDREAVTSGLNYTARLINASGGTIASYTLDLPVLSDAVELSNAEPKIQEAVRNNRVAVPYDQRVQAIDIHDPDGKIYLSVPVGELTRKCGNFVCEKGEDASSCGLDCVESAKDGYCNESADDICDPDCTAGSDPDCRQGPAPFAAILTVLAVMPLFMVGMLAKKRFMRFAPGKRQ